MVNSTGNDPVAGFMGSILKVDLSTGAIEIKALSAENVITYLGGRGLATYLLTKEIDPRCDSLGSENAMVFQPLVEGMSHLNHL